MHDLKTELAALLESTLRIQALIEQGDWASAGQLDAERQVRLHAVCAQLALGSCPADLREALAEIARLNDHAIGSIEHHQRKLLRDSETLSVSRKAVAAYGAGTAFADGACAAFRHY